MAMGLLIVPLICAAIVALVPSNRLRPWLLPFGSGAHLLLTIQALNIPSIRALDDWIVLDDLGKLFLGVISVMHFLCMCYAPGYLRLRPERSNRVLCACLLMSLSAMTLVVLSHHLGLMWVAVEATTLISAPSIYFNHNPRSIEATWKYLLICSVGIAIALLGSFFLAYSAGRESTLQFETLVLEAPQLSKEWLHAAFVLLLVGYGTKMGLAPMHTWKPDAYGEAPGLVGALLAGGVTNVAFFAILRFYHIMYAAGDAAYARQLLLFLGLLSMATAAVFMIRQRDFKRLLAYSSVEHMGILVFGIGIGGPVAIFGSLLHMVNNAMTKGVLFLSAGNIHRAFKSKSTAEVHGAMASLPLSSSLLVAGFLAGCGSPPFGPFVSEFTIVTEAFANHHYVLATVFLAMLMIIFVGMGSTVLSIVLGKPSKPEVPFPDGLLTGAPVIVFMAIVTLLGVYLPEWLRGLLNDAVTFLQSVREVGASQ
ncbi:MAG: hydrogenase [Planctomycetes bacterium]|nr:hydrogenase [Planctomycetota bacterium]